MSSCFCGAIHLEVPGSYFAFFVGILFKSSLIMTRRHREVMQLGSYGADSRALCDLNF